MNDGYRHWMCRARWNKRQPKSGSAGREAPKGRRSFEIRCFGLNKHHSGIRVAKNPADSELRCGGSHESMAASRAKVAQP
jgi:hypothetical protein